MENSRNGLVRAEDLGLGLRAAYVLGTSEGVTVFTVSFGLVKREGFWGTLLWLSCQEGSEGIYTGVDGV